MRFRRVIISILFSAVISMNLSCEFSDLEQATIPSYICVTSFGFTTDTSQGHYQGQNTAEFKDLWVTANGTTVGSTSLPLLLPVNLSDSVTLSVDAGIIKSGQDDQHIPYPFIKPFQQEVKLVPGEIDTVVPVFSYLSNVNFKFIYDLDYLISSHGFTLNPIYVVPGDTMNKVTDGNSKIAGNPYLQFEMAASSQTFRINSDWMTLPGQGTPVYLEFDYLNDVILEVGYKYVEPGQTVSTDSFVIGIYPSGDSWKKMYLNLTDEVSSKKDLTNFQFYFNIVNTSGIKPNIRLDNIKILTF